MHNLPKTNLNTKVNVLTKSTSEVSFEEKSLNQLFKEKRFVIIFQPGAGNPAAGTNPSPAFEKWILAGLGGCTPEVKAYCDLASHFEKLNTKIFIVSTMTVSEQKAFLEEREINPKISFIADFSTELKEIFGVETTSINGRCVYKPISGFYDKQGMNTELKSDTNARKPASEVLNYVNKKINPKQSDHTPEPEMTYGFSPN